LPPESAEALLNALLGEDRTLELLKRVLIERTEGNPFFLEESVQTLVETKVLVGERGAYRMPKAPDAWQIPATAQAILAARIDRLLPDDKRFLQAASVIGKDVPFALLKAIADVPEDHLRRGLAHLQVAEFLYETSLFPDLEYTFKHALTLEVAYGSVLQDRRRALHTRIADAIEALYLERLTEQVERLAYHAFRGEAWEKAVTYLRQAGARAFARSANREAVGYFEQALTALQHRPETRETLEQAIDLRFDLRPALFALGDLQKVTEHLREAESLAQALGDQLRLGRVSLHKSHYLWSTGHAAEARASAENALAIAEALGDFSLQVGANHYLGAIWLTSGNYRHADTFLRTVVYLLGGDRSRDRCGLTGFPAAMARGWLAWALAERGAFDEGIVHGQDGLRLAEALDHPYSWIAASWGPAHLYPLRGEISQAVRLLERALSLCRDWDIRVLSGTTAGHLGFVYVLSGRVAEGLALLSEGQESEKQYQTLIIAHMGEACLHAGRVHEAITFADRALTVARERGQRGYEAHALRLLGEIAAHPDSPDAEAAAGYWRQAMALADELGMRPLDAHCHLGLGKLYRRAGNRAKTDEYLTTAATMYHEMGMNLWLAQAEAQTGSAP
jgi:tetratricopeptide (TPR) repeat protein